MSIDNTVLLALIAALQGLGLAWINRKTKETVAKVVAPLIAPLHDVQKKIAEKVGVDLNKTDEPEEHSG